MASISYTDKIRHKDISHVHASNQGYWTRLYLWLNLLQAHIHFVEMFNLHFNFKCAALYVYYGWESPHRQIPDFRRSKYFYCNLCRSNRTNLTYSTLLKRFLSGSRYLCRWGGILTRGSETKLTKRKQLNISPNVSHIKNKSVENYFYFYKTRISVQNDKTLCINRILYILLSTYFRKSRSSFYSHSHFQFELRIQRF